MWNLKQIKDKELLLVFACFVYVLIVLMFLSRDSYLHNVFDRGDPAWYFLCGKAWMNGLTPYVDFADSKGPLLWLICGIGYLISPRDYIGVFWMTVIAYTATSFYIYKTAYLLLGNWKQSAICMCAMLPIFFNIGTHDEVKSEDFSTAFIACALYLNCLLFYGDNSHRQKLAWKSVVIGGCMGATLLMKYTATAMCAFFAIAIWCVAWQEGRWRTVFRQILWQLLGIMLICLPFVVYLLGVNAFSAFIHEYFVNTLFTVHEVGESKYVDFFNILQRFKPLQAFLLLLIWSCIMPLFCFNKNRWYPLATLLWFALPSFAWPKMYYMNVYTIFISWWMISAFMMWNDRKKKRRGTVWIVSGVAMFLFVGYNLRFGIRNLYDKDCPKYPESVEASIIMTKKDSPTYMRWDAGEQGEGILANALPACKYWARQVGATKEMHEAQKVAVYSHKADFVIIQLTTNDAKSSLLFQERRQQLLSLGYQELKTYVMADGKWVRALWGRE